MEVSPKQLHKHAIPVVMVMMILLILPAAALTNNPAENSLAKGLVTRVINVRLTNNGLVDVSLNDPATDNPPVGSYVNNGLDQTGRDARLWLKLQ